MSPIRERFIKLLKEGIDLEVPPGTDVEIDLDAQIRDYDLNSLAVAAIVKSVNEEFNVQIPLDNLEAFKTPNDLLNYLEEHGT